jgi:acetyl esterase/lipase
MKLDRRTLIAAGATLAAAPALAAARAATPRDPLWFVDPELRPKAREIQQEMRDGAPLGSPGGLAAARKGMSAWAQPPSPEVTVDRKSIAGPRGAPQLAVYVINAQSGASRPGILHMHGGGFVLGSPAGDIPRLQSLAKALDCAIVSVDYRLAPETRFTGSIEDNYAGLLWLQRNAGALGVDPARLAIMGESAGGGHAALLAIAARDRGEVPLVFQCLTYPMLDDRTGSTRAVAPPIGTLLWNAEANRFGWRSFLGEAPGGASVPARAVPARTPDLAGLPPAWIGVGGIDLFVDEDIDYARRLIDAGVPTDLIVVPGAFHGFDVIAEQSSVARRFNAARLAALKRGLNPVGSNT